MSEEREPKRVRQACQNCRRKKTRCSGEQPACAFCLRLGQNCEYGRARTAVPAGSFIADGSGSSILANHQSDLAARVALLESRLGISAKEASPISPRSDSASISLHKPAIQAGAQTGSSCSTFSVEASDQASKFSRVPPMHILKSLADVYFLYCHNQPYSYFLEDSLRRRLDDGDLPEYLLLAFAGTAARYSTHDFFEGRQAEATETYAQTSWRIVLQQVFSSDNGLDLHVVQATNLLAIIDFTAGQHRLGWVKIGLAVRFAQGLRLNAEPDSTIPYWQQEEHRRVFWSVYILDKFVSCCRLRPPTILDVDCTVKLPSSELSFRNEAPSESPTIAVLKEFPDIESCKNLDHFAMLVLVASTLGHIVRHGLQQNTSRNFPPWDFRSDFARTRSTLLSFEALLTAEDVDFLDLLHAEFGTYEGFDRQRVGHFVWCRGLYHLCCCLLYHPFLLYRDLQQYSQTFPRSFARESLRCGQEHAEQLTKILMTVQESQCCACGSFLGYFAAVANSVHRLYEHSTDPKLKARSIVLSKACLDFLEQPPLVWKNYKQMAIALRNFDVSEHAARILIEPSATQDTLDSNQVTAMWHILDYGWLSDANRTNSPSRPATPLAADFNSWSFFESLVGRDAGVPFSNHQVQDPMVSLNGRDDSINDWWFHSEKGDTPHPHTSGFQPRV